jgi:hypothetical protein
MANASTDASNASFTAPALTDKVTGISLPTCPASASWPEMIGVWGQIARWTAQQLISCGYLDEAVSSQVLGSYHRHLAECDQGRMPKDFLVWLAHESGTHQPNTADAGAPDEELHRVQSAVHARVFEQQPPWRFGNLPGRLWSQAAENPGRRRLLTLLRCGSLASEDGTLVHIVGFNPVAVRLAARWLAIDETSQTPGDNPSFIFPFVVEREVWRHLYERQFPDEPS